MLSTVRNGARIVIIKTGHINILTEYLEEEFTVLKTNYSTAYEKSNENTTIIVFNELLESGDNKALLIEESVENILCSLINRKQYNSIIDNINLAPRIIIMRTFGDTDKVIKQIIKDYKGVYDHYNKLMYLDQNGTIIYFTQGPLNKPLSFSNLNDKAVFINGYPDLYNELKVHDLKYLNLGFDNKDWYEITIKIYDIYGEYMIHYERLLKVIENLELGLILGESWGTDAAKILLSVEVYRIRFFTYFEPSYIKKILLGLEYLENGERIVDLDLYCKRRKISWTDVKEKDVQDKLKLSRKYRNEILEKFNEKDKLEFFNIEKRILETRD